LFIDETWAKTNMTRRYGRCRRGARLIAKVPHGRWRTLTFLAALRHDGITAPCVIDGPINGASFRAYIEQFLVPTGDVVVMDNLASHKAKAVRPDPHCRRQAVFPAPLLARSQSRHLRALERCRY
jgi:DDE superfamily endonuclease